MHLFGLARSGKVKSLAILLLALSLGIATAIIRSSADDVSVQAIFFNLDLSATAVQVSVLGANADDHLSGNGTPDNFNAFPRARAIATGDFNDDNFQDVIIGAPDVDFTPGSGGARANSGAAYVVFGRNNFTNPTFIDANLAGNSLPNLRIFGAEADDNLGFAVAAGDVNGDGIDDIILGAPGADFPGTGNTNPERNDTGAVYVLLGAQNIQNATLDLAAPNVADSIIFGERTGDRFGSSIAVANVGGSGAGAAIVDLVIGAPSSQGPDPVANARANGGAAYALIGLNVTRDGAATRTIDITLLTGVVRMFGRTGSLFGSSVAIGNVLGDGFQDIFVGAPMEDRPAQGQVAAANDTGAVFAFSGGANLLPSGGATSVLFDIASATAAQRPDAAVYGAEADDHLGAAVAAGSVMNDGNSDLIIGAPDADGPDNQRPGAGEVYVIADPAQLTPTQNTPEVRIDLVSFVPRLVVLGAQTGSHLGEAVLAGRINTPGNTDNATDLIMGMPGFDAPNRANAGAVAIVYNGNNLPVIDLSLNQEDGRVVGQAAGDELGWALGAADLDNNTAGDLIMGAPFHDVAIGNVNRANAGRVYVRLALQADIPPVEQPPTVTVTLPNGGETITGGTNQQITWTASDPDGDNTIQRFEIRLSTDAGATFNTIITSNVAGNARTFTWQVPTNLNTNQARIRVIAFDNGGLQGQDDSNANFTITNVGTVTLVFPNGGQDLKTGTTVNITWAVDPVLAPQITGFDLFLSTNGGASFSLPISFNNPVIPSLPADARQFTWTVPNVCAPQSKILVSATTLTGVKIVDESNSNFSISAPGPTVDVTDITFNNSTSKIKLEVTTPGGGTEIRFASDIMVEISTDAAGTQFFMPRIKVKSSGRKLELKSPINNQNIRDFVPDQAIRVIRFKNPPCGITEIRVQRQGLRLVPLPGGVAEATP